MYGAIDSSEMEGGISYESRDSPYCTMESSDYSIGAIAHSTSTVSPQFQIKSAGSSAPSFPDPRPPLQNNTPPYPSSVSSVSATHKAPLYTNSSTFTGAAPRPEKFNLEHLFEPIKSLIPMVLLKMF